MKKLRISMGMLALLCFCIASNEAESQMLAEITSEIETDFGRYHPYPAACAPNVPFFSVKPDFSNVVKELENMPLADAEYENIFCFGKAMQKLVAEMKNPAKPWLNDMAVVADVHTDTNTRQCLEEGVGYPLEIFVIVNEGGNIRLTRGAMFSYYEFTQPIANRLTDEAWRELLTGDSSPPMPEWVVSLMDTKASSPPFDPVSPASLYYKEFTAVASRQDDQIPQTRRLSPNYPNPFNPGTTIEFDLPHNGTATLTIYDLNGRLIRQLHNDYYRVGLHKTEWDGRDQHGKAVASGVYIIVLKMRGSSESRKMIKLQ